MPFCDKISVEAVQMIVIKSQTKKFILGLSLRSPKTKTEYEILSLESPILC